MTVLHAALPQVVLLCSCACCARSTCWGVTGGLALNPLSPNSILDSLGTLGVFLILFAETGPSSGSSCLVTRCCSPPGCSARRAPPPPCACAAARAPRRGGRCPAGCAGGLRDRAAGRDRGARPDQNQHLLRGAARGEELFARYGHAKAIVIGRFIPVVRTVLNPMAGGLSVSTRTFTIWQVAGGLLGLSGSPWPDTCWAPTSPGSTPTSCRSSR